MASLITFDKKTRMFANKHLAVHPTVSLSILDHYDRVAKDTVKRVVGVLLGEFIDGAVHATNCFAVPFEEDHKDQSLWFLDHNYLESMAFMFAKISKKERIVGWYSTGDSIKPSDLEIDDLMRKFCPLPIYFMVSVNKLNTENKGLPFSAYIAYEEPSSEKLFRKTFAPITSGVAQFEAEEVGVEHLLRDIEALSTSARGMEVVHSISGLKALSQRFAEISEYLKDVTNHKLPVNHRLLTLVQEICNLSPNVNSPEFIEAMETHVQDALISTYAGSVVRTATAVHDLVKNRLQFKKTPCGGESQPAKKEIDVVPDAKV